MTRDVRTIRPARSRGGATSFLTCMRHYGVRSKSRLKRSESSGVNQRGKKRIERHYTGTCLKGKREVSGHGTGERQFSAKALVEDNRDPGGRKKTKRRRHGHMISEQTKKKREVETHSQPKERQRPWLTLVLTLQKQGPGCTKSPKHQSLTPKLCWVRIHVAPCRQNNLEK